MRTKTAALTLGVYMASIAIGLSGYSLLAYGGGGRGRGATLPRIVSVSPREGGIGTPITLIGQNFTTNGNAILVNGKAVVTDLPSDGKTLTFTIPPASCKVGKKCLLKVQNSNGRSNAITLRGVARSVSSKAGATPATPFPGEGIPAIPAMPMVVPPGKAPESCEVVPYHQVVGAITSVAGTTADISLYPSDIAGFMTSVSGNGTDKANRVEIRSLLQTRGGTLLAAGSDYLWGEWLQLPSIYRSTDQGKTWTTASVPTDSAKHMKFVNDIAEDSNGVLYAVGMPGVLRSTDGGATWTRVQTSFVPYQGGDYFISKTYNDFVRNVLVLRDNSVLITVPFYYDGGWGYGYTNVYRSTDAGATWSLLFTQKGVDMVDIVETQDGVLVFTDQSAGVYRFTKGVTVKVFQGDPRNISSGPFLQARGGTLYYVLNEEKTVRGVTEVVPTVHRSGDSGLTWRKVGTLPVGSSLLWVGADHFAEGSDGQIYLAVYSSCSIGTVYRSPDGRRWEVASGSVPDIGYYIGALEDVNGKMFHGGNLGGVIFRTP